MKKQIALVLSIILCITSTYRASAEYTLGKNLCLDTTRIHHALTTIKQDVKARRRNRILASIALSIGAVVGVWYLFAPKSSPQVSHVPKLPGDSACEAVVLPTKTEQPLVVEGVQAEVSGTFKLSEDAPQEWVTKEQFDKLAAQVAKGQAPEGLFSKLCNLVYYTFIGNIQTLVVFPGISYLNSAFFQNYNLPRFMASRTHFSSSLENYLYYIPSILKERGVQLPPLVIYPVHRAATPGDGSQATESSDLVAPAHELNKDALKQQKNVMPALVPAQRAYREEFIRAAESLLRDAELIIAYMQYTAQKNEDIRERVLEQSSLFSAVMQECFEFAQVLVSDELLEQSQCLLIHDLKKRVNDIIKEFCMLENHTHRETHKFITRSVAL